MSHPVFLTSSHMDHMPVGSQNQWAKFFQTASFELEANAFIPILWLMLFKQDHILWAKYTDDLDINDERGLDDLEEYQDTFGDHYYAYLVIDQKQALINLENHRPIFTTIFGTENIFQFEQFKSLIEQYYPQYILLRTSGLPIDSNDANFLIQPLQHIENFHYDHSNRDEFSALQRANLARFDDHPYFFYGVNNNAIYEPINNEATQLQENQPSTTPQSTGLAILICTIIVVIVTFAVWFTTYSALYAVLAFLISALALGLISSKLGQQK
ncbi:MAG: hypothetical protein RR575_10585 [Acinetobacter sp.]